MGLGNPGPAPPSRVVAARTLPVEPRETGGVRPTEGGRSGSSGGGSLPVETGGHGPDVVEDLVGGRESKRGLLRVDEPLVDPDLEDPAPAGEQAPVPDPLREGLLQLGRQTDGSLVVASSGAVFDAQVEGLTHPSDPPFLGLTGTRGDT